MNYLSWFLSFLLFIPQSRIPGPGGSPAGGNYIQDTPQQFLSTNAFSVIMGSNVTSGNSLVCMVEADTSGSDLNTPTDTLNSTWTRDVTQLVNAIRLNVWRTTLGSSGAETVTIGGTGGNLNGGACLEYKTTVTLDQHAATCGASSGCPNGVGSSFNGASVTTAFGTETIITMVRGIQGGVTIASPFTTRENITFSGTTYLVIADQAVTSTGTYAPAATQSSSGAWYSATISLH